MAAGRKISARIGGVVFATDEPGSDNRIMFVTEAGDLHVELSDEHLRWLVAVAGDHFNLFHLYTESGRRLSAPENPSLESRPPLNTARIADEVSR